MLYLGVVNSVLAYVLWNSRPGTTAGGDGRNQLYVQPILGATLSWLFLSERLPATFIPGAALVMTAVWIAGRPASSPAEHRLEHQPEAVPAGVSGGERASHR